MHRCSMARCSASRDTRLSQGQGIAGVRALEPSTLHELLDLPFWGQSDAI